MKWDTKQMAARAASVATIWGMEKFLSSDPGKRAAKKVDTKMQRATSTTTKAVRSGVRNAWSNRAWASAGIAMVAAGVAMLGRSVSKR
ncbi:MAG: hypothetical protein ACRD2J_04315 [Thermoanaerobaculia bacterium]